MWEKHITVRVCRDDAPKIQMKRLRKEKVRRAAGAATPKGKRLLWLLCAQCMLEVHFDSTVKE